VKPNLVVDSHPLGTRGIYATVVHGAIIRVLIDYIWIALKGHGGIVIADSPIKEVDFDRILEQTGILASCNWLVRNGVPISTVDLRDFKAVRNSVGILIHDFQLEGDPAGYATINLGTLSAFHELDADMKARLRSTATYYENPVHECHDQERHVYSVARSILEADVIVSVAKLKTHIKSGVTLSLKNMVGVTNEKRWLPHYRVGDRTRGGDMHPESAQLSTRFHDWRYDWTSSHRAGQFVLRLLHSRIGGILDGYLARLLDWPRRPVLEPSGGNWYGNDTVWRMALDLNRIVFYADRNGEMREQPQRRYLSFIDGVLAGEGEGPLAPIPKPAGVIIAGENPIAVDIVGCSIMGFDWRSVPTISNANEYLGKGLAVDPDAIQVVGNEVQWQDVGGVRQNHLGFIPPRGWSESPFVITGRDA